MLFCLNNTFDFWSRAVEIQWIYIFFLFQQFILFGTVGILSEKYPSPCLVSSWPLWYPGVVLCFLFKNVVTIHF